MTNLALPEPSGNHGKPLATLPPRPPRLDPRPPPGRCRHPPHRRRWRHAAVGPRPVLPPRGGRRGADPPHTLGDWHLRRDRRQARVLLRILRPPSGLVRVPAHLRP